MTVNKITGFGKKLGDNRRVAGTKGRKGGKPNGTLEFGKCVCGKETLLEFFQGNGLCNECLKRVK